jgi:hypothetical protein
MRRLRRFSRLAVLSLFALWLALGTGTAQAAVTIELQSDVDGADFAGTLERDGVRIAFESRATPGGAVSLIRSTAGEILSEVIADEEAGSFEYRVGGIALSETTSREEMRQALKAFARADAALAAEHLWRALIERGFSPESRQMSALAANLTGYGAVPEKYLTMGGKAACLGCCGPSCWGCTGCYTSACLAHDLCVERYGYADSRCNESLFFASLSAWCCRGIHLGSLC